MASQVAIVNLALTMLGSKQRITSLTDDSSVAADMNAVYDLIRKAELRAYRWSFALKRDRIPAQSTPPLWGFQKAYRLPNDFLALVQCGEIYATPALSDYVNSDNSPWAIESGLLLTDMGAPLPIRYVRDVKDEGEFDALFAVTFACKLAHMTCEAITGSTSKQQFAMQVYDDNLKKALRTNAVEKPPASIADDSWNLGRV